MASRAERISCRFHTVTFHQDVIGVVGGDRKGADVCFRETNGPPSAHAGIASTAGMRTMANVSGRSVKINATLERGGRR